MSTAADPPRQNSRSPRNNSNLPRIVEPHHHFVAASMGTFHGPLQKLGVPDYTPEQLEADMGDLQISKAVHVECIASSGLGEAEYVEQLIATNRTPTKGIVAGCDLSADDVDAELRNLKERAPHVVGIRHILDYDGPFGDAPATHVATTRHLADGTPAPGILGGPGVDFLRHPEAGRKFEAGYALLAKHGLRFDLQCAPAQLDAAAALIARHPDVPVVLDHLAKPRLGGDMAADTEELVKWRRGMTQMAAMKNVYVKLSMLGYAVPGWVDDVEKEALISSLVCEVIDLFGPKRCMFSANWWSGGVMANSDGRDKCDISMTDLWQRYHKWVKERYTDDDLRSLFAESAETFYGI